jgi:hypothetical protein
VAFLLLFDQSIFKPNINLTNPRIKFLGYQSSVSCPVWLLSERPVAHRTAVDRLMLVLNHSVYFASILVIASIAILRCSLVPMMGSPFAKGLSTNVRIALKMSLASSCERVLKVLLLFFWQSR